LVPLTPLTRKGFRVYHGFEERLARLLCAGNSVTLDPDPGDSTGLARRCESKEGPIVSLERARPKMCPAAKHVGPIKNLFLEKKTLFILLQFSTGKSC